MALAARRGLVLGASNGRSLAWSVAAAWHANGAQDIAIGVQDSKRFGPGIEKLARAIDPDWAPLIIECNVDDDTSIEQCKDDIEKRFDAKLDMLLHAVAFAPKESLKGEGSAAKGAGIITLSSREGFLKTMETSVYSFLAISKAFSPLLANGAKARGGTSSLMALSFDASERVVPEYGVMGPAKGALETCCRYAAVELGPFSVRANIISAGPVNTLSARGIPNFLSLKKSAAERSPLGRSITGKDVGDVAVFLSSDFSDAITGQTLLVDAGESIVR